MVKPEAIRKGLEILLVEDNPTDVLLHQEALAHTAMRHRLHVVADGMEALAFLHHEGPYGDMPRPDLILLDLKLPKKNGYEVLAEVKTDVHLQTIPVVVLTTSQDAQDIRTAYTLHANCYIAKPENFQQLVELMQTLEYFWYTVVTRPAC